MKVFTTDALLRSLSASFCSLLIFCFAPVLMLVCGCALNQTARIPAESAPAAQAQTTDQGQVPKLKEPLEDEYLDDLAPIPNIRFSHTRHDGPPNQYFHYIESQLRRRRGDMDGAIQHLKKTLETDPDNTFLQRELTNLYLRNKKNEKALQVMEALVAKAPEDVELLVLFGKLKQSAGDLDSAREAYKKVIAISPDQEEIYILLGNLYMEAEQYENAEAIFNNMTQRFSDAYAAYYLKGKAAQKQGQYRSAAAAYRQALALEPELDEARFALIEVSLAQGFYDRSEHLYKDILANDPDNVRALFGLALLYHKAGKTQAAENLIRPLGKKAAAAPDILRKIVQLYINEDAYEDAAILLEKMLETAPDNDDVHYVLGVALSEMDQAPEAIRHLMEVGPDSMFFQNAAVHIAFLRQEAGEIEEAIRFMQQAIQHRPENLDFRLYLASFYEELKDYNTALKTLRDALEIDEESPRIHFRLGVVHDKKGDKNASIKAMRRVIELDPDNANALNYLGYTLADMGQSLDEAEILIRRALELKPQDGYITDSLGWVFFQQGRFEIAAETLERAVALAPDDPVILEHLGDAYHKLGQTEKALDLYRRSLEKALDQKDEDSQADPVQIREKIRNLTETLGDKDR